MGSNTNTTMAPQKFADLGKEARDLLSKNFHFGAVKLEAKTKTANGVNFTTEGSHNTDTGDVAGSIETKVSNLPYGLSLTKKWTTNNVFTGTCGIENKLIDGLKVDLDTSFAPITGKMSAKLKTDFTAPTVNASGVLAYQGWHLGYQGSYDTAASKLVENNACLTYKSGAVTLHAAIVNASKYIYSAHHDVNSNLQVAAALQCDAGSETGLNVGAKFALDGDSFVKAKLDNKLNLGVSYSQKLTAGVQATLSALVNGKALDQGGHKIGLHLNFDA